MKKLFIKILTISILCTVVITNSVPIKASANNQQEAFYNSNELFRPNSRYIVYDKKNIDSRENINHLNSLYDIKTNTNEFNNQMLLANSYNTVDIKGLPNLPTKYSIKILSDSEDVILNLMNKKRIEARLKPLSIDKTLRNVARYKSNHMIQYNYFSHVAPNGTNWTHWLSKIGYNYSKSAENIAYNNYNPTELFTQWWNSPSHRKSMMNPSYTKVGIGVILGDNKYMGTQEFSN